LFVCFASPLQVKWLVSCIRLITLIIPIFGHLFVGVSMPYLRYLCLIANIMVCFLFCLSSSCVLCTQCCQFLWIVHFFDCPFGVLRLTKPLAFKTGYITSRDWCVIVLSLFITVSTKYFLLVFNASFNNISVISLPWRSVNHYTTDDV
jgi:hypothetical protein